MSDFIDALNELKTKSDQSSKKTFSIADFNKLATSYLNDVDYKVVTKNQQGEEEIEPVKQFRGSIKKILKDFGVDNQDAEAIMNDYRITNVQGIYELCSELVYQYTNAGKKFTFLPKDDFVGSLYLEEVPETTKLTKGVGDSTDEFIVNKKAHKKMKSDSGCPKWLRTSTKK